MKFVLPNNSKNSLIKAANLVKEGFAKWEKMTKTKRNIISGVSFVMTGLFLPKAMLMLVVSSVYAGRHMYLNGEVERAAEEIVIKTDCSCSEPEVGHL